MATTIRGVRLDDTTFERIRAAARQLEHTPHWLIRQAIHGYLDNLDAQEKREQEETPPTALLPALPPITTRPAEIPQAFRALAGQLLTPSPLRDAITAQYRCAETEAVPQLLPLARLPAHQAESAYRLAYQLAAQLRSQQGSGRAARVSALLQAFALSTQEGVALMCLAEALLRIPDRATRDALIRDKISGGNWQAHLGHRPSLFVNAAAWGLLLTGRVLTLPPAPRLAHTLHRLIRKGGSPLIRKGMDMAMRLMGNQFVIGETITGALANARHLENKGFTYSYDMLGEAALSRADANAYLLSYQQAIHTIGKAANGRGIYQGPGISIKLSALHPRYSRAQHERVMQELYPTLYSLILLARHYDIGVTLDAEEAERLDVSLDLLEKLCHEPELRGWNGIGFVVQTYQKRALSVIEALIDLARRTRRRLMIRLVKGAYWDSEIKRAQSDGLEGYPVYTRKVYTDVAYLACARKLLDQPALIYPQFATHNAHTLAVVYQMAGQNHYPGQYEFQCLHGMGEPLYRQVVGATAAGKLNRPCRIYAPVGSHRTLLAYLVRRLLENGANTSFVNQIADTNLPLETLLADPIATVEAMTTREGCCGIPHPKIPLPRDLYAPDRSNSAGLDLSNERQLSALVRTLTNGPAAPLRATPLPYRPGSGGTQRALHNPADSDDIVGHVREATQQDIQQALADAAEQAAHWAATPPQTRATVLEHAAIMMEQQMPSLLGILIREAGKTLTNAIAEVREAVDFLNYYAAQVREGFDNATHHPLGVVVCISPWNFPLAIFTGQIAAALAAGNSVLAKPAEQTPLIAARAIAILHAAGVPHAAVQLLPGRGETVGADLVSDQRVMGVMFTGSTAVARQLQQTIADRLDAQGRPTPLIAETGGLNAMIVDSSALTEQVVSDVVTSAFDSAGQRCSALRILCLQEEIADHTLTLLRGAMAELRMGNPGKLGCDMGPIIDAAAKAAIEQHIDTLRAKGHSVFQAVYAHDGDAAECARGTFVPPTLITLNSFSELQREIFGPVLHVVRYRHGQLDALLAQINDSGYGLTLGIHSRIDATIAHIIANVHVGNLYVNRNIVGAVVGVQPFGGEGLSGTGPKAGGPLYLHRLLARGPEDILASGEQDDEVPAPLQALIDYATDRPALRQLCWHYARLCRGTLPRRLNGPTGESNTLHVIPRQRVLCMADCEEDILIQLSAACAAGCRVLWPQTPLHTALHRSFPQALSSRITLSPQATLMAQSFDVALCHGDRDQIRALCGQIAARPGAIVTVLGALSGETQLPLALLFHERAVSVNTTAAGGNASLMTLI